MLRDRLECAVDVVDVELIAMSTVKLCTPGLFLQCVPCAPEEKILRHRSCGLLSLVVFEAVQVDPRPIVRRKWTLPGSGGSHLVAKDGSAVARTFLRVDGRA